MKRGPKVVDEQEALGFIEPKPWDADGGVRREPVLDADHDPPRVVRFVGWQRCMNCQRQFWSEDVRGIRICQPCKGPARDQAKPARRNGERAGVPVRGE